MFGLNTATLHALNNLVRSILLPLLEIYPFPLTDDPDSCTRGSIPAYAHNCLPDSNLLMSPTSEMNATAVRGPTQGRREIRAIEKYRRPSFIPACRQAGLYTFYNLQKILNMV